MNAPAVLLAEKFFPGALTLVLPAKDTISKELTLNDSIGVRIPDDTFCLALAREFGLPYTTTSANKAGRETAKDVRHVLEQFGTHAHEIALVIDGGERRGEHPSTVVQVTGETPYVLREGALSKATLGLV
jgi:L-threonylcarbamoyladenylate synthase